MHPGWSATPGVRTSLPRFFELLRARLRTPEQGADTIVWLAVSAEVEGQSGGFWFDRERKRTHLLPLTRETATERAKLWALCESLAAGTNPVA
jgi:hypothetical protein